MSRIGKNPVVVPADVTVSLKDNVFSGKGKLGELNFQFDESQVEVKLEDNAVIVSALKATKKSISLWGTTRARINTLIEGVNKGFVKQLELRGVGYKARLQGNTLVLSLGYSHDINYEAPKGVKFVCASATQVEVSGADKQLVGQVAAEIRKFRSPEPYKGKGVRYVGEYVRRKEGKKK